MRRVIVTTGWLLFYLVTPWGVQAQIATDPYIAPPTRCIPDGHRNEAPTSVCVYEIDTTCWREVRLERDTVLLYDTLYWFDTCRIDTFPHWIKLPIKVGDDISPDTSWPNNVIPFEVKTFANPRVDTVRIVDTVIVYDTVCPCDHAYEWEYLRINADSEETTWLLDEMMREFGFYKTGRSRCIYCGQTRERKVKP